MRDPLLGTTLAHYELQERLGQGGMAAVYRAFQSSLGRAVAIKVLPLSHLADPTLAARFRREARLAANLMHPNIVPVYDFGEWEGYLYIVMALVGGGTLKDRMEDGLPFQASVRLVAQVADALAYAHAQGVYHRDVKPANVLLATGDWAMLGDFGIARALGDTTRLTQPYGTMGTPLYMAPEQWLGHEADGRADIYSLGVILFELLTGSPPFVATTPAALMGQHLEAPVPPLVAGPALPPGLQRVVEAALAKRPEDRYQHAGEFKAALEDALGTGRGSPPPMPANPADPLAPTVPNLGRTVRVADTDRRPSFERSRGRPSWAYGLVLGLMAVVCLVLAGGLGYVLLGGREVRETPVASQAATAAPSTPAAGAGVPARPTEAPKPAVQQPAPASKDIPPTSRPVGASTPAARAVAPSAQIERRVGEYFEALNAGDYARAHAICCTPGWRSRFPLGEWQRNFAGVTDLRYSSEFRYPTVEPTRVVAEVDYSFVSRGERRYFVLRWTFVPSGGDWLADDAQAFPQAR